MVLMPRSEYVRVRLRTVKNGSLMEPVCPVDLLRGHLELFRIVRIQRLYLEIAQEKPKSTKRFLSRFVGNRDDIPEPRAKIDDEERRRLLVVQSPELLFRHDVIDAYVLTEDCDVVDLTIVKKASVCWLRGHLAETAYPAVRVGPVSDHVLWRAGLSLGPLLSALFTMLVRGKICVLDVIRKSGRKTFGGILSPDVFEDRNVPLGLAFGLVPVLVDGARNFVYQQHHAQHEISFFLG
jgi:hypothetical protein